MTNRGRVYWIPVEGPVRMTKQDHEPTLEELQRFVEGWIELVRLKVEGRPAYMYVNEEGLLHGLPRNKLAMALTGTLIVGPVVLLQHFRQNTETGCLEGIEA